MVCSDHELLHQIQRHDAAAFTIFFDCHRAFVQRHLFNMVRELGAAEDLTQEVFLRVWTRAEQWEQRGEVKAWLLRIATNLALNHLRAVRRRPQQPLEAIVAPEGEAEGITLPSWLIDLAAQEPPAALERAEQMRRLRQLVAELPEEKRTVFRLVYDADMDLQSVADALGIPAGTVKSRLYYSKRYLTRHWEEA